MVRLKRKRNTKAKETNIRVRHFVNTKTLVEINRNLTGEQKKVILTTPFKWLVDVKEKKLICGVLLRELVSRWDIHSPGIRVANRILPFTTLDVCLGLGLRVVGEPVYEDDGFGSRVRQLFKGEVINVSSIVQKLRDLTCDDNVDDFCRVYIILAFATFYFPRATPNLKSLPFRILDDLGSLDKYDWGGAVYKFLVVSLNGIAPKFNERKNRDAHHIAGCAALLQVWAVEHLSLRPASKRTNFPRMKEWIVVPPGKCIVSSIFQTEKFIVELVPTEDDQRNDVVVEAINESGNGFMQRLAMVEGDVKTLKGVLCTEVSTGANKNGLESIGTEIPSNGCCPTTSVSIVQYKNIVSKQTKKDLLQELYRFCTQCWSSYPDEILVSLYDVEASAADVKWMSPKCRVNSMVIMLAGRVLMGDEIQRSGQISRFYFDATFAATVNCQLHLWRQKKLQPWDKNTLFNLAGDRVEALEELKRCNLIFAPALVDTHWKCYVLNQKEETVYVLDSEGGRKQGSKVLDIVMACRFGELLKIIYPTKYREKPRLEIMYERLPKQRNNNDSGIYILKYMELWDGVKKWRGKSMPNFTEEEVLEFRRDILCQWVLHIDNNQRLKVLESANLPTDLAIDD